MTGPSKKPVDQVAEVERLRRDCGDLNEMISQMADAGRTLTDQLASLTRWKADALEVLNGWEKVHQALEVPASPGQMKYDAVAAEIGRLGRARDEAQSEARRLKRRCGRLEQDAANNTGGAAHSLATRVDRQPPAGTV